MPADFVAGLSKRAIGREKKCLCLKIVKDASMQCREIRLKTIREEIFGKYQMIKREEKGDNKAPSAYTVIARPSRRLGDIGKRLRERLRGILPSEFFKVTIHNA